MALVLVKEDGTGKVDANSYATVAECDAYCESNLWTTWAMHTVEQREKALVLATRVVDAMYQFNGRKVKGEQALQWPRTRCPDPDAAGWSSTLTWSGGDRYVREDAVPVGVVQATCEMAKELLVTNRLADPVGEGLDTVYSASSTSEMIENSTGTTDNTTSQANSTKYSKSDVRPIITRFAQAMLSKYGTMLGSKSGEVRLLRT